MRKNAKDNVVSLAFFCLIINNYRKTINDY